MTWYASELEPLLAIAVALLDENGSLLEANAGFLRIIEAEGLHSVGARIGRFFIQPDFATLISTQSAADGAVYQGLLTLGDYRGRTRSLRGRIWHDSTGLRVLAEYDIEDLERLYDTVLELNRDYASAQLILAQTNLKLQQINLKLRLVSNAFNNTLDMICITDAEANIVDMNPAFSQAYNLSREALLGKNLKTLKSGFEDSDFSLVLWETVNVKGHWRGEIQNRKASGELDTDWLTLNSIRDRQGAIANYVAVFSNVSQLFQRQRNLEFIANHDPLTGLPNRILLTDRLKQAIANAERNLGLFAVCYLDLDGFKPINDRFGHAAGDQMLCEIAKRLQSVVRNNDTVARVGGDEFVVVLEEIKSRDECDVTLDRLLDAVGQPISVGNASANVTISIGYAIFPHEADDAESLLKLADQAMYLAKNSGKSFFHFSKSIEHSDLNNKN